MQRCWLVQVAYSSIAGNDTGTCRLSLHAREERLVGHTYIGDQVRHRVSMHVGGML